ncbi:MAG: AAA family ATPase [Candidatus Kapabacteria bacterium]|nr:AAA family ATPase [Candidatus Kapabacteria bacterium]
MINKILIQGYKSIRNLEIELSNLNILIGANGVGKSNFISFFEMLSNIYDKNLQNYTLEQGGADNLLYFGSKVTNRIYTKIFFENTNCYELSLNTTNSGTFYFDYETNGFNTNYDKKEKTPKWKDDTWLRGHSESSLKDKQTGRYKFINDYLRGFKVFHFNDTSNTAKVKKSCNINDNSFLRMDASNLSAFLYLLKYKYPKNFNLIESTIKSVAPYFNEFDLKPLALNPDFIKIEWKETGTDTYFDANNLSDGSLRFICLATLLLQPHLPKTIIIDEPELGLHPFAINKLAGLILSASQKTQVIISTQSVNLIENFEPENILVVDREEKQSVFKRLSKENLKDWLEDYTIGELWEKNVIGGKP